MLKIDDRIAVLLTVLGIAVTLIGVSLLMVWARVPGGVLIALGLAASSAGYRAVSAPD